MDVEGEVGIIVEALSEGNIDVLELYYNNDHKLINYILTHIVHVNPSLIDYLLSKKDIIFKDIHTTIGFVLTSIFRRMSDYNSYIRVLEIVDLDLVILKDAINNYIDDIRYCETDNTLNISRKIFLYTVDVYLSHKFKLSDIIDILIIVPDCYDFAYYNVRTYVLFKFMNEQELRSTPINKLLVLHDVCYFGGAPKDLMILITEILAHVDDVQYYKQYYTPQITYDECYTHTSLFVEDV